MPRYPYTILPTKDDKKVYKPLIDVILNYRKTHKITSPIKALIDSGADVCFCADFIGIWLGIQLTKIKQEVWFTAANNEKFPTKPASLMLHVANKNYPVTFYFSNTLSKNFPIILGQIGFFDKNVITFNLKEGFINVE